MRGHRWGWPGLLFHATGAVAAPVCVIGMAYGGAWYAANGRPGNSVFLGNTLIVTALILGCASGFLCDGGHPGQPFVAVVTSLVLATGVIAVADLVNEETLRVRGVPTRCVVLDVDRQVHTTTYTDSNGITHTSTRVDYKHTLHCAAGRPRAMTLDKKWADKGEHITVTYDPRGRIGPEPTRMLKKDGIWHALAFICPPVTVGGRCAVLLAALWSDWRWSRRRAIGR